PAVLRSEPLLPTNDEVEKVVDLMPNPRAQFAQIVEFMMHQQPFVRSRIVQAIERIIELAAGNLQTDVTGGGVFQRMGFVENDDVVVGKDADVLSSQRQIAEEQAVIDDEKIGAP